MEAGTIVNTPLGLGRVIGFDVHHSAGRVIVVKIGGGHGVHGFQPHEITVRKSWAVAS